MFFCFAGWRHLTTLGRRLREYSNRLVPPTANSGASAASLYEFSFFPRFWSCLSTKAEKYSACFSGVWCERLPPEDAARRQATRNDATGLTVPNQTNIMTFLFPSWNQLISSFINLNMIMWITIIMFKKKLISLQFLIVYLAKLL